jgi:hypothetical protein
VLDHGAGRIPGCDDIQRQGGYLVPSRVSK